MVVTVEARKFNLPHLSLSSPQVTSFLYEPSSSSLALMHSDSTFSLFPSFCPFSISSSASFLPPPQTLISPPSSAACFVPIVNPNPKVQDCPDDKRAVFVTAGPHKGGSKVVLRFFLLGIDGKFVNVNVGCSQNGVCFVKQLGVIVDVKHGLKVMLSGSANYLALYSASGGNIWLFGVKLVEDGRSLRLVKCAVIDCRLPVSSICLSFGFLMLGEFRGVRVFPLRALVKGRAGNRRRPRAGKGKLENSNAGDREVNVEIERRKSKMSNGVIRIGEIHELDKNIGNSTLSKQLPNGHAYSVLDGTSSSSNVDGTVKPRSLNFRQDSGEWGMQFVMFEDCVSGGVDSRSSKYKSTKVISIQAVSREKFLILDSNGDLHTLHVSKSGSAQMKQLTCTIQVHQFAALPAASPDSLTVWTSDGLHSVHVMVIPGLDATEKERDGSSNEGESIHSSVTQAIFMSENIQHMMPLAANRVLILGQDSLYAYAIS